MMETIKHEKRENNAQKRKNLLNKIKKYCIYTVAAVGGIVLLGLLCQLLEYLFVGAILLLAWLAPSWL